MTWGIFSEREMWRIPLLFGIDSADYMLVCIFAHLGIMLNFVQKSFGVEEVALLQSNLHGQMINLLVTALRFVTLVC